MVLESGQQLIGEPQGLTVATHQLVPASGGPDPDIANSTGDGLILDNNATVRHVDVEGTSGHGITSGGASPGVGGTVNAATFSDVEIKNTTGTAFRLSGGSGSVTAGVTIAQTVASTGRPVHIENRFGGTVTFTGPITSAFSNSSSAGQGIALQSNFGTSTIDFQGKVDIRTDTSTAFLASGGGTVKVASAGSKLRIGSRHRAPDHRNGHRDRRGHVREDQLRHGLEFVAVQGHLPRRHRRRRWSDRHRQYGGNLCEREYHRLHRR